MAMPNNWFREHNPGEIIAMVAQLTLATISTWTSEELDRVGWTNNSIIAELYGLGNTGVWAPKQAGTNPVLRGIEYSVGVGNNILTTIDADTSSMATNLALLAGCIDANRLKTIETP